MRGRVLSIVLSMALVLTTVLGTTGSAFAEETQMTTPVPGAPAVTEAVHMPVNYDSLEIDEGTPEGQAYLESLMTHFDCAKPQEIKVSEPGYYIIGVDIYAAEKACKFTANLYDPKGVSIDATEESASMLLVDPETGLYRNTLLFMNNLYTTGTYRLELKTTNGENAVGGVIAFYYGTSPKATPQNLSGKGWKAYSNTSSGYSWFKVTMPKSGYITFCLDDSASTTAADKYSVRLYNSTKSKCLSGGSQTIKSSNDYKTYFGVKKGTYYVRVYNTSVDFFSVKAGRTYVTDNAGSSKSKAARMYKGGSTKKGIVTATQSSTYGDYYYFKLTKKQRVDLSVIGRSGGYSGGLKVTLYKKGSSKIQDTFYIPRGYCKDTVRLENRSGSTYLTAGTYYLKVQKYKSGSGYYSLKWK